jgi:hypothetical protein
MSTSAFSLPARLRGRASLPIWLRHAGRQTIAGVVVAVGASALTLLMVHGTTLKGVAALVVVVGSLWFLTTRNVQLALAVLMLYLGLLDGYLKLATGSNLVTFVRDMFLFALVAGLLIRAIVEGRRLPLPPLSAWAVMFALVVLAQLANPRAGTLVHSLAGVRQHLEFVPLFFLAFAYVRTTKALRMFCILLAVIATANAVASWVQFNETPQQFAAWGPGYTQRVLGTGTFTGGGRSFTAANGASRTRPFGLGSDAGDGGLFCVLAFCGILALASFSRRRRDMLFAVAMALGAVLGIVTSEGRGVIISTVIVLLAFGLMTITAKNRMRSLFGLVLVLIAAAFVVETIATVAGSSGLRYAGLSPSSIFQTTSGARGSSLAEIPHNIVMFPFGAGLATAGPAATSAPGASATTLYGDVDTETEFSFLVVETGIPGMLVITGFTLLLLYLVFTRVRREPDREARVLLSAVTAPLVGIFGLFFSSAVTASVPIAPYLWAIGGIISYWLIALPAARHRAEVDAASDGGVDGPPLPRLGPPLRIPVRTAAP